MSARRGKKLSEFSGYNPARNGWKGGVGTINRKRERMRGNPGMWASRKDDGTWTVYSLVSVYREGLSEDQAKKTLQRTKIEGKEVKQKW